jgi:hypothetical protein
MVEVEMETREAAELTLMDAGSALILAVELGMELSESLDNVDMTAATRSRNLMDGTSPASGSGLNR